jgi:MFS family permease
MSSLDSAAATDDRPALVAAATSSLRFPIFAAVVRHPIFRRLWLSAMAASLGQWMQTTALGWLALDLTNSKSFVGLVAFMAGVPFLVISIPAGVLIDRFDRRKVLMTSQALAALLACLVAIDVIADWVQPWHLLFAAFFNGSLQAILSPTQQSLVPSLVPREDLTNAVGLISAGQNMTRVVGPSLAGR